MKKANLGLLPKLLLGILIGMLIGMSGSWFGIEETPFFTYLIRILVTFADLFSTFLEFLIPLLILSFVSVALAELGKKANSLFIITLGLAYVSTILAGLFAFGVGHVTLPHLIDQVSNADIAEKTFDALFTLEVNPIFDVMTALILSFTLGIGMANIKEKKLFNVLKDLQNIVSLCLSKVIIPVIPFYIAAQFANIAATGKLVETIKLFAILFILIIVTQWVVLLLQFGISSIWCGENEYKKIKNILPAYFTALGTQSSAATIPVNLECAYKNGMKKDVANFVIPLCATIHLAGDTVCLVLGTMGIMLMYNMDISLAHYFPFILMLGITMVAAPGVPGGGVMSALGIITSMFGFTDVMQSLIISLHFSQDSFGTAANVTGDQTIGFIVDRLDERAAERRRYKEGKDQQVPLELD